METIPLLSINSYLSELNTGFNRRWFILSTPKLNSHAVYYWTQELGNGKRNIKSVVNKEVKILKVTLDDYDSSS